MTDDSDFEKKVTERLRSSSEELDAATRSRLNQARQRALDELPQSRGRLGVAGWWLPAGSVAAAALFAIILWQGRVPDPGVGELPQAAISEISNSESLEIELLLHEEDLAMFEELEFYAALTDAELGAAG